MNDTLSTAHLSGREQAAAFKWGLPYRSFMTCLRGFRDGLIGSVMTAGLLSCAALFGPIGVTPHLVIGCLAALFTPEQSNILFQHIEILLTRVGLTVGIVSIIARSQTLFRNTSRLYKTHRIVEKGLIVAYMIAALVGGAFIGQTFDRIETDLPAGLSEISQAALVADRDMYQSGPARIEQQAPGQYLVTFPKAHPPHKIGSAD